MGKVPFIRRDGQATDVYAAPFLLVDINEVLKSVGCRPISMECTDGVVYVDPDFDRIPERELDFAFGKNGYMRKKDSPEKPEE